MSRTGRIDLVALALVACTKLASAQHHNCDPYTRESKVPVPKALQLATTCGNGRIDAYAFECTKRESGGCNYKTQTSVECPPAQELCDRGNLNNETCKSQGFAAGTLACATNCDSFRFDGCTLCLPGTTCTEQTVIARDFEDITLLAQGETIRAFWYDTEHYYCADIDAKGKLVNRQTLGDVASVRLVPAQIGSSALTIVGAMDHPQLSIVDARGKATLSPLAGTIGMVFLPITPVVGKPLGVMMVGEIFDAHVTIVDERGKAVTPTPLYARNAHHRIALLPLTAANHHVQWSNLEDDFTAEPGDLLFVMHDFRNYAGILRKGVMIRTSPAGTHHVNGTNDYTPEPSDILLDGRVVVTFSDKEDVVLGAKRPNTGRPAPPHVFGELVYTSDEVPFARSSKLEVQVARVKRPDAGDDDKAKGTLVISVRKPK
jgi:hypothetical protein